MVERTSIDEEPIVGVGLPGYPRKGGVDEAVISFELVLLRVEQLLAQRQKQLSQDMIRCLETFRGRR